MFVAVHVISRYAWMLVNDRVVQSVYPFSELEPYVRGAHVVFLISMPFEVAVAHVMIKQLRIQSYQIRLNPYTYNAALMNDYTMFLIRNRSANTVEFFTDAKKLSSTKL